MLVKRKRRWLLYIVSWWNSDTDFADHSSALSSELCCASSELVNAALESTHLRLLAIAFAFGLCCDFVALVEDHLELLLGLISWTQHRLMTIA